MEENEETFYAGLGVYGVRDKETKKTIRYLDDYNTDPTLTREKLLELGKPGPYFLYVKFPVEVDIEFGITRKETDESN